MSKRPKTSKNSLAHLPNELLLQCCTFCVPAGLCSLMRAAKPLGIVRKYIEAHCVRNYDSVASRPFAYIHVMAEFQDAKTVPLLLPKHVLGIIFSSNEPGLRFARAYQLPPKLRYLDTQIYIPSLQMLPSTLIVLCIHAENLSLLQTHWTHLTHLEALYIVGHATTHYTDWCFPQGLKLFSSYVPVRLAQLPRTLEFLECIFDSRVDLSAFTSLRVLVSRGLQLSAWPPSLQLLQLRVFPRHLCSLPNSLRVIAVYQKGKENLKTDVAKTLDMHDFDMVDYHTSITQSLPIQLTIFKLFDSNGIVWDFEEFRISWKYLRLQQDIFL